MSYVVSVYGKKAFRKILLPGIINADYEVILHRDMFGFASDIVLTMENIDQKWFFKKNRDYTLSKDGSPYEGLTIRDYDIIQAETKGHEKFTILINQTEHPFAVYKKYSISNLKKVTIGKSESNHIRYDYFGMVSKEHAVLEKNGNECRILDKSANGTFVNNRRVKKEQRLLFGDSIHIMGLQIIYLKDIIAVEQSFPPEAVDSFVLQELNGSQLPSFAADLKGKVQEKSFFHRTPRNIEKIDTEPIEIEEPPAPARLKNQSMLMAVGPAFSMAIPMLLGSLMSIFGSRSSGSSSLFMYAGLVTAVSSAVVGAIWATVNVKNAAKEAKDEEKKRKTAYVEYLQKMMRDVQEKYDHNARILHTRYPDVKLCAEYGKDSSALWNRNPNHEDVLYHRIGLGRIPFQAPISIPKERFRVNKDELAIKPKDIQVAFETLKDVPVGIDFRKHPLMGIIGGSNKIGALEVVQNLLVQIAAGNCYTDVKIGVIYHRENGYETDYLACAKWLPHVWAENKKLRYVADTASDAADVFYDIARILRDREETGTDKNNKKDRLPYYILFVTDTALLEGELIAKYVYDRESNCGLSTVLLAENYEDLPNSCEFIIQNDEQFQGYYSVTDDISERVPVRFDELDRKKFEAFARRLSAIEVNVSETGGEIPNTLTFFEMMGINRLEEMQVAERWRKNRTYDSMKAIIGQKSGGVPCYLDIHEKYHGPHGLVAGTTGSGKSETLQTYILSLAVNYSPDDVGFFVIDYKGGGMANLFSSLPHTIGQISNLSGNQVHRAMISIKSENRRRQQIFNEHGVNNINNYTRLYKNNEASVPVPHLFIVIDEFAELKREEPDFMKELISVAQVGRSLGVHLILATQKPSGTVDDNIWSNAKFRLCLRVQDKQDSMDMLHKPDAAYITQAGRCYLQVGNDEIYELFQSGWSGAAYDDMPENSKLEIASMYSMNGKAALVGNRMKIRQKEQQKEQWIGSLLEIFDVVLSGMKTDGTSVLLDSMEERSFLNEVFTEIEHRNMDYTYSEYNARRIEELLTLYTAVGRKWTNRKQRVERILGMAVAQGKKLPEVREKTQLDAVVEYLALQAKENGYTNRFMLWLPVLPEKLYLKELKGYSQNAFDGSQWPVQEGEWKLEAYIGLLDDPVNQAQTPLLLSFSEGGNHAVCGTVVTGKSTFLQTLIFSMAQRYTPEYVNFYLLDFSSHMLGAFEGLAHVGGVVYENDLEKLGKFFNLIDEIMAERKELLQGGNYAQYVRANGVVIPAIVIVIDQFSNFTEKTEGKYEEKLIQISRNGAGYGIYLLMTSAGFGMTEIPNRIGDNVRTVYSLEMNDKFQYADILHMLRIDVYPESGVKGRGLVCKEGTVLEFQTALCAEAEDDYTRTKIIGEICRKMNQCWKGRRARQIPEIPENPVLQQFMELESVERLLEDNHSLPLGYNQENASAYAIELSKVFCYLIQGKTRTGKTNLIRVLAQLAVQKGGNVAVVDFDDRLGRFAEKNNIFCLKTEGDIVEYWKGMLPDIQKRNGIKKEALRQEMEDQEIYERMAQEQPYYLFIDDLAEFVQRIYQPSKPEYEMREFLENIIKKGRLYNLYIFAAFNPAKTRETAGYPIFEEFVHYRTGIHLGGNTVDQQILDFEYIPFNSRSQVYHPGIGQLPAVDGEVAVKTVVIPLDRRKQ